MKLDVPSEILRGVLILHGGWRVCMCTRSPGTKSTPGSREEEETKRPLQNVPAALYTFAYRVSRVRGDV